MESVNVPAPFVSTLHETRIGVMGGHSPAGVPAKRPPIVWPFEPHLSPQPRGWDKSIGRPE